jgi:hypothetical protein
MGIHTLTGGIGAEKKENAPTENPIHREIA